MSPLRTLSRAQRWLAWGIGIWLLTTATGAAAIHQTVRIRPAPMPSAKARAWALETLSKSVLSKSTNAQPHAAPLHTIQDYRAAGPLIVLGWRNGRVAYRFVGSPSLVRTVRRAARELATQTSAAIDALTITVNRGAGPTVHIHPYLAALNLVPLSEGLIATLGDKQTFLTPDELQAEGVYDAGVQTPIPDLRFGVPMEQLVDRMARDLGVTAEELHRDGSIRRFRATTMGPAHVDARESWAAREAKEAGAAREAQYPKEHRVIEGQLRAAAKEGAGFLLRHQHRDGRFTYIYDARTGRERVGDYNIPRHAGSTYFLAQVDHLADMPSARTGALRALKWLARITKTCGAPENLCIEWFGRVDVGSAALAVVAAAELLAAGDDPTARRLVEGLTAFLRAQQRPDGELMHEYDRAKNAPIDVQLLYYSGEAAFALLRAYRVMGDERNLRAAKRLMKHLTGAGWNFFGSRYYYGEEHWTCIAAGEARGLMNLDQAVDFCGRWFGFNERIQFRRGETPWNVAGAYGAGPLIVPRITPVGSRSEAFVSTYELFKHYRRDTTELRALIERGLGQLLRWRFAPGPTHLLADPARAHGGVPGSPVDLTVRNDYVQHAGSAWIRWADVLRRARNP